MDLAFIFGANGRHAKENLKAEKEIAKKIVASHKISNTETQVGAIVYESDARLVFGIGEVMDKNSISERIGKIQKYMQGNNIEKALQFSMSMLSSTGSNTTRHAMKALILFLDQFDGLSSHAKNVAKQMKDSGVKIIVIKIGNEDYNKEVVEIPSHIRGFIPATDPTKELDDVVAKVLKLLKTGKSKLNLY